MATVRRPLARIMCAFPLPSFIFAFREKKIAPARAPWRVLFVCCMHCYLSRAAVCWREGARRAPAFSLCDRECEARAVGARCVARVWAVWRAPSRAGTRPRAVAVGRSVVVVVAVGLFSLDAANAMWRAPLARKSKSRPDSYIQQRVRRRRPGRGYACMQCYAGGRPEPRV
jgi:hypothetical protein